MNWRPAGRWTSTSAWPPGRASIHEWPPGTHWVGTRTHSENSAAVAAVATRSKQPHNGRMGRFWAARRRTSGRRSTVMSMLPTGRVRVMVATLRRMSGRTERIVEYMRPMNRSGVSKTTAAIMSTRGAASGEIGAIRAGSRPRRTFQAGVATPSRYKMPRVFSGWSWA